MKEIPKTEEALVLRTDFSDESAWQSLCDAVRVPVGEFRANVNFLSDPDYDGVTAEQLPQRLPEDYGHTFLFLVDGVTLSHPDHPVLVLDLDEEVGRSFRVIPTEMWGVENNLSLANMDFGEFAEAVDADGIFRGFSES